MTRSKIHLMQDNGGKRSVAFSWHDVSFRHAVVVCVCLCGGGLYHTSIGCFLQLALNNVKRLLWNVHGIQK